MSTTSNRIEALAALHNRNPLHLLEWLLERAAIREYEAGTSRVDAESAALADIESELEGRS